MPAVARTTSNKPGPKPNDDEPRKELVALKCRASWKAWVIRFSKHRRSTPSGLIDFALMRLAQEDGFEPPPER
jgi:hypothetical protein